MANEYFIFYDDLTADEINILDYYWLVNDQCEFYYTVSKVIEIFNLDGPRDIKYLLGKCEKVGVLGLPRHCSGCMKSYSIKNRSHMRLIYNNPFDDLCEECSRKDEYSYSLMEWKLIKQRIESKNIKDKFPHLPYQLKLVVFGFLDYLFKARPESFDWNNYRIISTPRFDELVFDQLVLEGIMCKFESGEIFDKSPSEIFSIEENLKVLLKGEELEDFFNLKRASERPGFFCCYGFYKGFSHLYDDLKFMESNIRSQVLREYDVNSLEDFILDFLSDRCIYLCYMVKIKTNVEFVPTAGLYSLFKEMLLNLSVSQVYSLICGAFKSVAAFLYNNDVDKHVKPHLIKSFISKSYYRILASGGDVPSFDISFYSLNSIFERIVCLYVFDGRIKNMNEINVRFLIRAFYKAMNSKRLK